MFTVLVHWFVFLHNLFFNFTNFPNSDPGSFGYIRQGTICLICPCFACKEPALSPLLYSWNSGLHIVLALQERRNDGVDCFTNKSSRL